MSLQGKSLRLRRTQKLLREALIELIEERGFNTLTVGEITERAMISRAAFYRNYQDKYDLVEQIFAEAMQALFATISIPDTLHSPQIWERFFEHIAEYERLYRALLGRKGSPWFVQKMRASLVDLVKEIGRRIQEYPAAPPIYPDPDEFVANLIATMLVEAITWWLEKGMPYPPKEIARRSVHLAGAMIMEARTWQ